MRLPRHWAFRWAPFGPGCTGSAGNSATSQFTPTSVTDRARTPGVAMTDHDEITRLWSDEELDEALRGLHAEVRNSGSVLATARAKVLAAASSKPVSAAADAPSAASADEVSPATDAAAALGATDEPVAPGQYRYIETHAWNTVFSGYNIFQDETLSQGWFRPSRTTPPRTG